MKRNLLILLALICLTLSATVAGTAQNTFEGKKVVVYAKDTGGQDAVTFGTAISGSDYVSIKLSSGNRPANNEIFPDDLTTPSFCTKGVVSSISWTSDEARATLDGDGRFCFLGTGSKYSITVHNATTTPSGKIVYNYWPANPTGAGELNVKDFGAKGDGVQDDTEEIRSAIGFIASRGGGTLRFPIGDYRIGNPDEDSRVSNSGFTNLTLPSGIIIVGATSMPQDASHGYTPSTTGSALGQFSRIRLSSNSVFKTIFRIGERSSNILLKNIVLRADTITVNNVPGTVRDGTIGLEARGTRLSASTQSVGVTDVGFETVDYGFKLDAHQDNGPPVWQFDYVKVDHCSFTYNKTAGIYLDSQNSDWRIVNSIFYMPKAVRTVNEQGEEVITVAADGIRALHVGGLLVESTFAGGSGSANVGGNFIDIDDAALITIIGSQSENTLNSFVWARPVNSGGLGKVITFVSNVMGRTRFLHGATFISTGNFYGADTFDAGGVGTLDSGVVIYSTGDRFCQGSFGGGCVAAGTANFKGGTIGFSTGQFTDTSGASPVPGRPATIGTGLNLKGDANNSNPILSINGVYPKTLLELGDKSNSSNPYVYKISRDANGFLSFEATQPSPYRGYRFDAPVTLQTYTINDLPPGGNGMMVYCSNCQKTAPCTAGGTGALAVVINYQYECK